jgi:hypothetical protein
VKIQVSFKEAGSKQILDDPHLAIRVPGLKGNSLAIRMEPQKTDAVHANPCSMRLAAFCGNHRDLKFPTAPLHEHDPA